MRFTDRVALVTGGGRGIGAATAELLAREGARVVVSDMDVAPAEEVARPIGALAVACDVTDREQVEAMVRRAVGEFGRLDVLVCCAGIIRDNLLFKMSDDRGYRAWRAPWPSNSVRSTSTSMPSRRDSWRRG